MERQSRGIKKKRIIVILIIFLVLGIAVYAGIVYLNKVFLPVKIKALAVKNIEKVTNKKVTLQSLQFSLFKGLAFENLAIYDGADTIINLKSGSCALFIPALFKKQIVISSLSLDSPVIFLERRSDNTFNLFDLFPRKEGKPSKKGFGFLIHKLNIRNARIDFRDSALPSVFNKSMDNLNLAVSLSLPANVRFKLESSIPATPEMRIKASGNYKIPEKELQAKISIKDLSPKEFSAYYQNMPGGLIDVLMDLKLKDDVVFIALKSQNEDINLQSKFTIRNKLIDITQLSGRYLNSEFSAQGNVDAGDVSDLRADIGAELDINLPDIQEVLKTSKKIEEIKPVGKMHTKLNLNGNIRDIESCKIKAEFSSPSISAYGLNFQEFRLVYNQENGLADIPLMRLSLYGGEIQANANMNLRDENIPYWASADIREVKIEKLKLDTPAKNRNIAGTVQAQIKINGLGEDFASTLRGTGNIRVTKGKLWQLDLFKGIGELLFVGDYVNIVFSEGYCDFSIQDETIFTDNLQLKSNLVNLAGPVRIGFDNSINASIDVSAIGKTAPAAGTFKFKDVLSALIGQVGKMGVIKISGTLQKPEYKFEVAVIDIFKKLRDSIFKIPSQ